MTRHLSSRQSKKTNKFFKITKSSLCKLCRLLFVCRLIAVSLTLDDFDNADSLDNVLELNRKLEELAIEYATFIGDLMRLSLREPTPLRKNPSVRYNTPTAARLRRRCWRDLRRE